MATKPIFNDGDPGAEIRRKLNELGDYFEEVSADVDRAVQAADAAEGFRDEAQGFAGSASSSASAAAGSALAAADSAGIASTKASEAEASANTASAKAGEALASAEAAQEAADILADPAVQEVIEHIEDIQAVNANAANITAVAGIDDDVSAVAGIAADVTAVAAIDTDVAAVAGITADVTTVAGNAADISTVAGKVSDIEVVAGIAADVSAVAEIDEDVSAVAGNATDISAVAGNKTNIDTVAGIAADVSTVAGIDSDVSAVAGATADVSTVATNISDVQVAAADMAAIKAAPDAASTASSAASTATTKAGEAEASALAAAGSASTASTKASEASGHADRAEQAAEDADDILQQVLAHGNGWTPVLAMVSDGERRVIEILDWTGGQGTKPATGYLGATGVVSDIAQAIDVRGAPGEGAVSSVNSVEPDGSGNVSLGISDIPGLEDAIDNAGQVKTVAGKEPDGSGNVSLGISDIPGLGDALDDKVDKSGLATVATTGSYDDLTDKPTLGTAAAKNVPASGNAEAGEVVLGSDTRLTDPRDWNASTVSQAEAEAGTSTTARKWTAQRVWQAITAWWNASAAKSKLDGIEAGATANQTDAYLLDRANHTGTQPASSIAGLATVATSGSYNDLGDKPALGSAAAADTSDFAPSSHVGAGSNAHAVATTSTAGFMSSSDKTKLDGIEAGAQVNAVTSVAGKTGAVTLAKGDVGLGNVDNTSDMDKPISNAVSAALAGKASTAVATQTTDGLLSAADKVKLDALGSMASHNVFVSFANPVGGIDHDFWFRIQ